MVDRQRVNRDDLSDISKKQRVIKALEHAFDITRRLEWSVDDDALILEHLNGLKHYIGEDIYYSTVNHTGADIPAGTCVGFAGVNGEERVEIQKYIADGTFHEVYLMGVTAEDIADDAEGKVTAFGYARDIDTTGTAYGETWLVGDILYAHPTTLGGLTKVKPTAPNRSMEVGVVLKVDASEGILLIRPTLHPHMRYGVFSDTTDQTASGTATPTAITFNTTDASDGVSIGTPTSRIVCGESGLYNFQFSLQVTSTSSSVKYVEVWPRINGINVANSNTKWSINSNTAVIVPALNYILPMDAGDYFELIFAVDDTNVKLDASAATGYSPAIPSVILTVTQVVD